MSDSPPAEETHERRQFPTPPGFVEVRDGNGRLLFLFDAARDLVQIKPRGDAAPVLVDLRMYREGRGIQGKLV